MTPRALVTALLCALAGTAAADEPRPGVEVYGYFQQWLTAWEEMGSVGGAVQPGSGDTAADSAAGFRLHTARIGLRASAWRHQLGLGAQVRLEEQPAVLDLWGRLTLHPACVLYAGQMRIPSTWENLVENSELDFLIRPPIAEALADYSLSRTYYASSVFWGNRSAQRDLGVAVRGELHPGPLAARYFAMVGNGLGANLFIGGDTAREVVLTNPRLQLYYGLRLEVEPIPGVLVLGGHGSYNRHDDMAATGGHAVIDLDRRSWSVDARVDVAAIGLRAAALYGAGVVDDDTYATGRTDLDYLGWEGRLVWRLNPLLAHLAPVGPWRRHVFEVGLRYDGLYTEANESGAVVKQDTWTPGLSYCYRDRVKVQLDAFLRRTRDPAQAVPDNDAVILGMQVQI